jgi:hypothetical protein
MAGGQPVSSMISITCLTILGCRTRSTPVADHRGSSGIHFNRRRQNLPAEKDIPIADGQSLEIEIDGLGVEMEWKISTKIIDVKPDRAEAAKT